MSLDLVRAVFFHAHPDDETLATGSLLAGLAASGYEVAVVTATRGEQGEIRPGVLDRADADDLVAHRERELDGALAALGVRHHAFLGSSPALAGHEPRRYTDSGMRWVTPSLAGPGENAGPDSLTSAAVADAAADLAAFLRFHRASCLVSYDIAGGYGHPDHVACHNIAVAAARLTGLPFAEIVSEVGEAAPEDADAATAAELQASSTTCFTYPELLPAVRRALACYASQLGVEGSEVVHVGGQREPIRVTIRLHHPSGARGTSRR